MAWLLVLGIFSVRTDVDACNCTQEHCKRVCTGSWLEKNPLPNPQQYCTWLFSSTLRTEISPSPHPQNIPYPLPICSTTKGVLCRDRSSVVFEHGQAFALNLIWSRSKFDGPNTHTQKKTIFSWCWDWERTAEQLRWEVLRSESFRGVVPLKKLTEIGVEALVAKGRDFAFLSWLQQVVSEE